MMFQSGSPHRSKGRYAVIRVDLAHALRFNPLPSPKQGEIFTFHMACRSGMFQSAPLTEARGDLQCSAGPASHRSFNPLPSPKQGEMRISRVSRMLKCFNPLPSPKQGEMPRPRWSDPGFQSFNPLPSPKQGEITMSRAGRHTASGYQFQSAPLTEARGDIEVDVGESGTLS